jgi:hypothetical protein
MRTGRPRDASARWPGQQLALLGAAPGSDAALEAATENKFSTTCARTVPYGSIATLTRHFRHEPPLNFRVLTASAVLPSAMCLGHRSKRQASHCLLISSCCSWAAVGVPLEDRLVCFAPRLAPASPQLPAHSINRAAFRHINSPRALHARRPSTLTHAIGASRRM